MEDYPSHEDVTNFIIEYLRSPPYKEERSCYGYDVYVRNVILDFVEKNYEHPKEPMDSFHDKLSPVFLDACWELSRRGIIRPNTRDTKGQGSSAGIGYSVTEFGKQWLKEVDFDDYVPTEPGRFAQMLEPFKKLFIPEFHQRAQEAIRCYGGHCYLACLAMTGAASEAILKSIVNELKITDLRDFYKTKNVINKIQSSGVIKREELEKYTELIKYWRDEGMHGQDLRPIEAHAFTSLALLLRFANFVKDKLHHEHNADKS